MTKYFDIHLKVSSNMISTVMEALDRSAGVQVVKCEMIVNGGSNGSNNNKNVRAAPKFGPKTHLPNGLRSIDALIRKMREIGKPVTPLQLQPWWLGLNLAANGLSARLNELKSQGLAVHDRAKGWALTSKGMSTEAELSRRSKS